MARRPVRIISVERRGWWPFRRWDVRDRAVAGMPAMTFRSQDLAMNHAHDLASPGGIVIVGGRVS